MEEGDDYEPLTLSAPELLIKSGQKLTVAHAAVMFSQAEIDGTRQLRVLDEVEKRKYNQSNVQILKLGAQILKSDPKMINKEHYEERLTEYQEQVDDDVLALNEYIETKGRGLFVAATNEHGLRHAHIISRAEVIETNSGIDTIGLYEDKLRISDIETIYCILKFLDPYEQDLVFRRIDHLD